MAIKGLLFDLFGVLLIKDQTTGAWLVNQELVAWLKQLKKQGEYKLGLVSNTSRLTVARFLKQAELGSDFFNAEVLSGEESFMKPDPRFFQLALERLKLKPKNGLLVDDSRNNILGAQALGLAVVWVEDGQEIITKIEAKLKEE